jgi:nitroreductase
MQQLASAALKSQRPPLALMGWMETVHENNEESYQASSQRQLSTSSRAGASFVSTIGSSSKQTPISRARSVNLHDQGSTRQLLPSEVLTRLRHSDDDKETKSQQWDVAHEFQTLIQTRRTGSHLLPRDENVRDASFWNDALERAVRCAIQAPNHKRTEPVTFKRMVAPSERTHRLSEIAYETHLRKKLESLPKDIADCDRSLIQQSLNKKRQRWDQVPAFLIALVTSTTSFLDVEPDDRRDPYAPLPFQPLTSDRELEDYATACAAVENCLLSLHAEHISTKWVTGPVIQTPAFRELIEATASDRVVALIMVGEAADDKPSQTRRMRRAFHGDLLVDL